MDYPQRGDHPCVVILSMALTCMDDGAELSVAQQSLCFLLGGDVAAQHCDIALTTAEKLWQ